MRRKAYKVIIVRGRTGFPKGEWTRVSYRRMAVQIVGSLRKMNILARVQDVLENH